MSDAILLTSRDEPKFQRRGLPIRLITRSEDGYVDSVESGVISHGCLVRGFTVRCDSEPREWWSLKLE